MKEERKTFKRGERLKSRKVIEQLFKAGESFAIYPLRLVFIKNEAPLSQYPIQFTVSVSKKRFKKAVDRNRIKRQIREAWRLNKASIYEALADQEAQYAFMIIYTAKEHMPFSKIERSMVKINKKFLKKRADTAPKTN